MSAYKFMAGHTQGLAGGADFSELIQTIQFLNKNTLPHFRTAKDYTNDLSLFFNRCDEVNTEFQEMLVKDLGYSPELAQRDWDLTVDYKKSFPWSAVYTPGTLIPQGLIAIYGSWSSPAYRFMHQVLPALLQENSVLLYCDPEASRIYCRLSELLRGTALSADRLAVLPIDDNDTLETLLEHPSLRGVQGQMHLHDAALYRRRPLVPEKLYNLHFGAHNPLLFMNDGDVSCISTLASESLQFHIRSEIRFNRWFVQEKIFPDVLNALQTHMKTFDTSSLGSMAVKKYAEHFEKQKMELRSTRQWLQPTDSFLNISTDFSNCSPLHQTELLGPLITITRFKNGPEATKFAGTTHHANATSIFTKSSEKFEELARMQATPLVYWNQIPHAFDTALDSGVRHCSLRTADSVYAIKGWEQKSYNR